MCRSRDDEEMSGAREQEKAKQHKESACRGNGGRLKLLKQDETG